MIYVQSSLKYDSVDEQYSNLKITRIIIDFSNKRLFKISGLYRCFDYDIESFTIHFEKFITSNRKFTNHFILGYVNIDLLNFDKKAEEYFYYLSQNGYQSMINTCTHPTLSLNEGSCIDHIFLRSKYLGITGKLIDPITDHYPVLISSHSNSLKPVVKDKYQVNKKRFIDLRKIETWEEIYAIQDNEEAIDLLISKIKKKLVVC